MNIIVKLQDFQNDMHFFTWCETMRLLGGYTPTQLWGILQQIDELEFDQTNGHIYPVRECWN